MSLVLGLTGEKLSGKSTASAYLVDRYQAKHYRFSEILENIADRLYLPKTRENEIDIALALRDKFGNEILAHVLKKDIEKDKNKISVIDGIRYWEEYHILKNLKGFVLLYITAPLEQRYERVLKRDEKEGEKDISFEDFKRQEQGPTEVTITELAKETDYKINNSSSFEDFYKKIETICQKLTSK